MTDACERAALVAAIRADPDDDTLRLAFADWLQERGEDERAEFIRVQVELARLDKPGSEADPRHGWSVGPDGQSKYVSPPAIQKLLVLRRRERELLNLPNGRLGWRIPGWFANWEWRRGFIESVTCLAGDWLHYGDAVYAEHPVSRVTLTSLPDPFEYRSVPRGDTLDFEWCVAGRWVPRCGEKLELAEWGHVSRIEPGAHIRAALETRWEGVKFEMPNWVFVDYTPWDLQAARMAGNRAGHEAAREGIPGMKPQPTP